MNTLYDPMNYNIFKDEMLKDEKLLWSGQPDPKIIFTSSDIFFIPFSLLWGGFAIFWETQALEIGAPGFFALFGIPFVLIGLYMIFGRFFYKAYMKKLTYYAVTDQRVIIITGSKVQALFIKDMPSIDKDIRSSGNGSIRFGNAPLFGGMYSNTGMWSGRSGAQDTPAFYDINNAKQVYDIVVAQKTR